VYLWAGEVFLTAFSTRVSPLSSEIHNGDDTAEDKSVSQIGNAVTPNNTAGTKLRRLFC